jgi:hypothetical protein
MSNDSDDSDDSKVGYKKPPKHTQFKKGQSGNPNGRPKGTKNLTTDMKEELNEQVIITEGGRDTQHSKQRVIVKRTVQKAINGDMRAVEIVIKMNAQHSDSDSEEVGSERLSPDDQDIIDRYFSEVHKHGKNDDSEDGKHDD